MRNKIKRKEGRKARREKNPESRRKKLKILQWLIPWDSFKNIPSFVGENVISFSDIAFKEREWEWNLKKNKRKKKKKRKKKSKKKKKKYAHPQKKLP